MDEAAGRLAQEAAELDARAAGLGLGEDSPGGRELRSRAAELRVRALGARVYPVLVCGSCFRLTGWTDGAGCCDDCVRREQLRAAYADPHGGFVNLAGPTPEAPRVAARPLRARLGARLHRDEAAAREWLMLVDPDETGPVSPEAGYEVEVARRREVAAADGSDTIVIRFSTATCRFDGSGWEHLSTTRIAHSLILVPAEFSAALPIEQLAEAWGDYGIAVETFNREAWQRESGSRERARQAEQARQDAIESQRNAVELLREKGSPRQPPP